MTPITNSVRILILGICLLFSGCNLHLEDHQVLARIEPLGWNGLESIIGKDIENLKWRSNERLIHIVISSDHDLVALSQNKHLACFVEAQLGGECHSALLVLGPYVGGKRINALATADQERIVIGKDGRYSYDIVLFATLGTEEKSDPTDIHSYNLIESPCDIFLQLRAVDMLRVFKADLIRIPAEQVAKALGSPTNAHTPTSPIPEFRTSNDR